MGFDFSQVKQKEHKHKKDTYMRTFLTLCFFKYIRKMKDLFILLEQDKGAGKSTLAIRLAQKWVQILKELGINVPFNFEDNIIYDDDLKSIMERIRSLPMYSPLIFDEGGRIILAEDWNKKANKELKKMFAEIRTKQLFVLICSPFAIDEIDKKYKKNFLHFWVHLWGFGYATIFRKNMHPLQKGFQEEHLLHLLPDFVDYVDTGEQFYQIINYVNKHSCYYQPLFWSALTPDSYAEYQKRRDYAVYEDPELKEAVPVKRKDKLRQYKLVKLLKDQGMTYTDISKHLKISQGGLSKFMAVSKEEFGDITDNEDYTNKGKKQ